MSYFEHTKKDVADARTDARREAGDVIAALADDTSRKLDDDTIDRQTLAEDLVTRLVTLSKALGSDAAGLFDSLVNFHGDNPRIPLDGEQDAEKTQEIETGVANYRAPLVISDSTLREVAMLETWDGGYPRHGFIENIFPDSCGETIRPVYGDNPETVCGRSRTHEIHNLNPEA